MTIPRIPPQIDPERVHRAFGGEECYPDDAKEFREQYLRFLEWLWNEAANAHYRCDDPKEREVLERRMRVCGRMIAETRHRINTQNFVAPPPRFKRLCRWLTRWPRRKA